MMSHWVWEEAYLDAIGVVLASPPPSLRSRADLSASVTAATASTVTAAAFVTVRGSGNGKERPRSAPFPLLVIYPGSRSPGRDLLDNELGA